MTALNSEVRVSQPRVLCRPGDVLGEGPIWDHRAGQLLWIDILAGRVYSWSSAAGASEVLRVDALLGAVALAGESDLLLATSKGLMRWHRESGKTEILANPIANKPVRFNDGRVDASGRFWVGTMALDPERYGEPLGELYRYDPDGSLHRMEEGLTIANGLDWSVDGRTFYLTDTMRRKIYAYDFDLAAGTISNRRTFVETAEPNGYPDGLVVDSEDQVWSAGFGGSGIFRYEPSGKLADAVPLSVSCPTAIAFGGAGYSTAFITTSKHALEVGHGERDAGELFVADLRASGRPAAVFARGVQS
jgi:sugar lactone lactonase YvrE